MYFELRLKVKFTGSAAIYKTIQAEFPYNISEVSNLGEFTINMPWMANQTAVDYDSL